MSGAVARQAVVLAGGKGTRLGALTADVPKPLLPIDGDRRFLDYLLEDLARQGFGDILLLAGHLGEQVEARYHGTRIGDACLTVLREKEPRGTGGALAEASSRLAPEFLMLNGDAMVDCNLRAFERAAALLDQPAVLAMLEVPDAARYGTIMAGGGRVTEFREKDPGSGRATINAGIYRLRREVLADIGELPCSIESALFPRWAAAGRLGCAPVSGWFLDIGLPETLARARAQMPARFRRPCAFLDRDGTLTLDKGYAHRVEDLVWMPGAREAVRLLNDRGWRVIVCTNQAGIAKGHFVEDEMRAFHTAMQAELAAGGAYVDAFYHCPYHPQAVVEHLRADHHDRKPNPGMLLRAMRDWRIDIDRSFMLGDKASDVEAGEAAGVRGVLYGGGRVDEVVAGLS